MSFCDAPDSIGGLPCSVPPVAISVLNELMNAQPSDGSLPQSARSCVYGGSSIAQEFATSMRPFWRSNFQNIARPRYLSLYSDSGAYLRPNGTGYWLVSIT